MSAFTYPPIRVGDKVTVFAQRKYGIKRQGGTVVKVNEGRGSAYYLVKLAEDEGTENPPISFDRKEFMRHLTFIGFGVTETES